MISVSKYQGNSAQARTRQNKVQQSPKFLQIVLQRCTGDEQSTTTVERSNDLTEQGIDILDSMRFINNDVFPTELLERRLFSQTHFVRSDHDIKVLRQNTLVDDFGLS